VEATHFPAGFLIWPGLIFEETTNDRSGWAKNRRRSADSALPRLQMNMASRSPAYSFRRIRLPFYYRVWKTNWWFLCQSRGEEETGHDFVGPVASLLRLPFQGELPMRLWEQRFDDLRLNSNIPSATSARNMIDKMG
jgi:hypothetical protein